MLRRTSIVAAIAIALVLVVNVGAFAVDPSIDVNPIKGISHTDLGLNNLWIVIGAVLVIFMQAGFALVETGFCRAKHAAHVVSTNFAIFGLGFVAFFLVGFSIMFGGYSYRGSSGSTKSLSTDSLIHFGNSGHWVFLWGRSGCRAVRARRTACPIAAFFLYMVAFMDTTATIPTGAMAERWKWKAFVGWGLFCGALYYPIFGGWTWGGGWLSQLGNSIDARVRLRRLRRFRGRPRDGRRRRPRRRRRARGPHRQVRAGRQAAHPRGAQHPDGACSGRSFCCSGGSASTPRRRFAATDLRFTVVAVNTAIAAAFGATVAMFYCMKRMGKPDPGMMVNGMLAGLVAITAPCAFVQPWAAAVIGSIAAVIVVESVFFFERKGIDDPVGAISVHGVGGIWGVLCVGIFADGRYGAGWNLTDSSATRGHGVTGFLYDTSLGFKQLGCTGDRCPRDLHGDARVRLRVLQDPERGDEGRHPTDGRGGGGRDGPPRDGSARLRQPHRAGARHHRRGRGHRPDRRAIPRAVDRAVATQVRGDGTGAVPPNSFRQRIEEATMAVSNATPTERAS